MVLSDKTFKLWALAQWQQLFNAILAALLPGGLLVCYRPLAHGFLKHAGAALYKQSEIHGF